MRAVRFHPRAAVLASGSTAVAWWLSGNPPGASGAPVSLPALGGSGLKR